MITSEDVVQGKPFPEPYLKGAALLGYAPEDCVVVEDAPPGINAGRKAGMRVIAVQTTYPAAELQSATVITSSLANVRISSMPHGLRLEVLAVIQL